MSETIYNQLNWAVDRLSWEDFQFLCKLYLEDGGYQVNLGKMPYQDGGIDLSGVGPKGPFVAHCTTQQNSLKKKILNDIKSFVSRASVLSESYSEIIYFSRKRVFLSNLTEEQFKREELLPSLEDADKSFKYNKTPIRLIYGDQIARELESDGRTKESFLFLQRSLMDYINALSDSDDDIFIRRHTNNVVGPTKEEAKDILMSYSGTSAQSIRQQRILDIVLLAYNHLLFRPLLADDILRTVENYDSAIHPLIIVTSKTALGLSSSAEEIVSFLQFLLDQSLEDLSCTNSEHFLLAVRVIRGLIYIKSSVLESPDVAVAIKSIVQKRKSHGALFLFDLSLRQACGYISLPSKFLQMCQDYAIRYRELNPTSILSEVATLIVNPLNTASVMTKYNFFDKLHELAKNARTELEARWVVATFFRISPLFDVFEDEVEYINILRELLDAFPIEFAQKSAHLQSILAATLLKCFLRRKHLPLLAEYERVFLRIRGHLLIPQLTKLQAEYAACVYAALQYHDIEELQETRIGLMLKSGDILISNSLFHNPLWANRQISIELKKGNKAYAYKWLEEYLSLIWRTYLKMATQVNIFIIFSIPAFDRIYRLRKAISDIVMQYFQALRQTNLLLTPSTYARSLGLMKFIDKSKNMNLLSMLLGQSSAADNYSILRYARDISAALYTLKYYGEKKEFAQASMLLTQLVKHSDATAIEMQPRLHWAYVGGIKYDDSLQEKAFINSLIAATYTLDAISHKLSKLALRRGEDIPARMSDGIIQLIEIYAKQGSLSAAALQEDLKNTETWNIIATTAFNHTNRHDSKKLQGIASLYSVAKCFARERKQDDQKYCYNYIRCRSLGLLHDQPVDIGGFTFDTCYYLSRLTSTFFAFKEECIQPFIELISVQKNNFLTDDRKKIGFILGKVYWLRKNYSAEIKNFAAEL
jgi:hypothetical protein